MKRFLAALAGGLLLAPAAFAQSPALASAADPDGLVRLLTQAGYSPTLTKDSYGDPQIDLQINDYDTIIVFYGCDETTHDNCDSVQLKAGFDRDTPWSAAEAVKISEKYRFAAVFLDESGDPWVQWDIVTGQGIPAQVFLDCVEWFGDTLVDAAEVIFPEE